MAKRKSGRGKASTAKTPTPEPELTAAEGVPPLPEVAPPAGDPPALPGEEPTPAELPTPEAPPLPEPRDLPTPKPRPVVDDWPTTKCLTCGSTERGPCEVSRELPFRGTDQHTRRPYTHTVWVRTVCGSCGQHRVDRHREDRAERAAA